MKEKKTTKKSVFLIGIGGISMSGLALILKNEGYNVSGSDVTKNENTQKLKEHGIKVYYSHKASLVKSCDLVVFSGAIKEDNPQIKFAKECGIEVIERSVLLARVSKKYKNVIAVSGTHGKTTTTAMLGYIFILAGLNPTIHVGGNSEIFNGNVYIGAKEYFITEACEFRNSFLKLRPKMSVITNVEKEHLDYFKSFEREILSFNKFVELTKEKVFINFDYRDLFRENEKIEFFNGKNIEAKNIVLEEDGKYSFDYYYKKRFCGNVILNVYGKYNIENALGVIGVCKEVGIQDNIIKLGFETFRNVKRRFEEIGIKNSNIIMHDYAHHPTEIKNAIKTAKEVYDKRLVCVFQPHTYSRTKILIDEFINCFRETDELYLVKSYFAREKYDYLGSVEFLKDKIAATKPRFIVRGVFDKKEINQVINEENYKDSVILYIGAGDIEIEARKMCK